MISWLLGYRDVPMGRRHLFRIDFQSFLMWNAMMALAGKNITQAIVTKGPAAHQLTDGQLTLILGLLGAAGAAGNIVSSFWTWLGSGRDSVKFILIPSTLAGACGIAVGLVPPTHPFVFTALVFGMFVSMSGVVTMRSAVWHLNYFRAGVGNIVSRFQASAMVVSGLIGWAASYLMDVHLGVYRIIFPVTGALGVWGGLLCQRHQKRRQDFGLTLESTGPARQRPSLLIGLRILRLDRPYRQFLGLMMIFGAGNMMADVVMVLFLNDAFHASFNENALMLIVLPQLVTLVATPFAGRLLDRTNPMRLRVWGASFWGVSRLVVMFAAFAGSLPLVILAQMLSGIGGALGTMAWQLGHMHFARKDLVHHYMGLHVTATGIRGIIAPFLGMALWTGAQAPGWLGGWRIPQIGPWLFAITFGMALVGVIGFAWMDRHYRNLTPLGPEVTL
ncbi:MAG: hypothetical protein BIFFINMI_01179 [Phycisphaerae bacterium]|nr:hypothetical protein [Phycisphaerae bacterium]